MGIFEKFANLNSVIIVVSALAFLALCVFLWVLNKKEAESYRKAVIADLKEPKETYTLEPVMPSKAHSSYTRNAQIIVQLNDWGTHARNGDGDFDCVLPDIKMTVDFTGSWDSKEKMDFDLDDCIKKLLTTYQAHISGELVSSGGD